MTAPDLRVWTWWAPARGAKRGPQCEEEGIERDSLLGVYEALFPCHVTVDFVPATQLTAESLRGYRLLHLPYPLMLPSTAAAAAECIFGKGRTLLVGSYLSAAYQSRPRAEGRKLGVNTGR